MGKALAIEEEAEICQLWDVSDEDGFQYSVREISDMVGKPPATVYHVLQKYGIDYSNAKRRVTRFSHIRDMEEVRILNAYYRGESMLDLEIKYHVNATTVYRMLAKRQLPRRTMRGKYMGSKPMTDAEINAIAERFLAEHAEESDG